jgi:hypothetical protein
VTPCPFPCLPGVSKQAKVEAGLPPCVGKETLGAAAQGLGPPLAKRGLSCCAQGLAPPSCQMRPKRTLLIDTFEKLIFTPIPSISSNALLID